MDLQNEKLTSGTHVSYWIDSLEKPLSYFPLNKNTETDVLIIGGGIAGITIAYCLCRQGKKVILVEDGYLGSGETGRTSAHLVTSLDDRYRRLEKLFGEEGAKLAAESHSAAIDFVEQTVDTEKINCEFERLDGYLFLHPSDKAEALEEEHKAALRAGLNVFMLDNIPGMKDGNQPCLVFPRQAQFHPLKYLKGLCNAITRKGGSIFTETHAAEITSEGIVTDKGFKVTAKHIVIATNSPVNNKFVMHLKQFPYRSYIIGARIKKGIVPRALWWDTGDFTSNSNIPPYHYIRLQNLDENFDLLMCGGEDHATGLAEADIIPEENRYALLEDWARTKFPIEEVLYKWSGQVLETMDALGFMGRNPWDKNNIYICTGDSGNGMTHCTIAGMIISDLINGKENKWEKLYSPSRFKIFKAGNVFFKEVIGGFAAYLKDSPKNADNEKIYNLRKDEAAVIEIDGKKYGAYCDSDNLIHIVDAECTHLKCIVKWNNDEKTWDCPCHGSRFTCDGKVMNGPAIKDLQVYSEADIEMEAK
ncbi:MAG: FAD-dependent oxidoreductase [Bacteroidia bacterium]